MDLHEFCLLALDCCSKCQLKFCVLKNLHGIPLKAGYFQQHSDTLAAKGNTHKTTSLRQKLEKYGVCNNLLNSLVEFL